MGLGSILVEAIKGNILASMAIFGVAVAWVTWITIRSCDASKFMKEIREKITEIFDRLPAGTTRAKSPLVLNDLGEKVAKEIKVYSWAIQYVDSLYDTLKDRSDPYEIQEVCFKFAQEEFLDKLKETPASIDLEKIIRLSAYNNGLEVKQILDVVGIILRDKLLSLCKLDTPADLPIPPSHLK